MENLATDKRQGMIEMYSDFYKHTYGVRPRFNYKMFSLEQLEEDFENFSKVCDANAKAEAEAENKAVVVFENRVQSLIDMGANDRKTALRWLVESYDKNDFYDVDFFIHNLGLGYSNDQYPQDLKKELLPIINEMFGGSN